MEKARQVCQPRRSTAGTFASRAQAPATAGAGLPCRVPIGAPEGRPSLRLRCWSAQLPSGGRAGGASQGAAVRVPLRGLPAGALSWSTRRRSRLPPVAVRHKHGLTLAPVTPRTPIGELTRQAGPVVCRTAGALTAPIGALWRETAPPELSPYGHVLEGGASVRLWHRSLWVRVYPLTLPRRARLASWR